MKPFVFALLVFVVTFSGYGQEIKPLDYRSAIVSIARYFTDQEKKDYRDVLGATEVGAQGTAWFVGSRRFLVTIEHVVKVPPMPKDKWTEVEITYESEGEKTQKEKCNIRLYSTIWCPRENLAILELERPLGKGIVLEIQKTPISNDTEVFSLGYVNGELRYAEGKYHGFAGPEYENAKARGYGMFELCLYNENKRLVLDHGSSGAPILGKSGKVVGVLNNIQTQTLDFGSAFGPLRVPTSWGNPTHTGVLTLRPSDFKVPK